MTWFHLSLRRNLFRESGKLRGTYREGGTKYVKKPSRIRGSLKVVIGSVNQISKKTYKICVYLIAIIKGKITIKGRLGENMTDEGG